MSNQYGPRIVTDGLVLCLDAGNGKSYPGTGTNWYDLLGNNNGVLINGPVYNQSNRGILNIDGTDDRIDIAYSSTNFINANFTWILWFIGLPNNNGPMPIFGYGSGAWPRLGIRYNNYWIFSQYGSDGTGNIDVYFSAVGSNTKWYCLAITADYTNRTIKTYTNGVLSNTTNNWRDSTGNTGNLGLGRAGSTSWPNAVLSGSVASFSIYSRALTSSEILQNYNATKGRFNL